MSSCFACIYPLFTTHPLPRVQMLEVAGNHMDMLESVLVRVEELLEQWTGITEQYDSLLFYNIIQSHAYITISLKVVDKI